MTTENGTQTGTIYVRFGDHPTDEMPVEWAEKMLRELKRINQSLFGRLLMHAIGIDRKGRS